MISSISIKNFKSYQSATLSLSPLTFFIGANASGKSNALEALRLLSWLAKGHRLDDIAKDIEGADVLIRGQSPDLFYDSQAGFEIGCQFESMIGDWTELEIQLRLLDGQLVISGERVAKRGEFFDDAFLYEVVGEANPHSDEIRVMYNNFKRGGRKPRIPCSNRQAVFFQLETPGRFDKAHVKSQREIPAVTKRIRESLRKIVFLDPRPSQMRHYSYVKNDEIEEDGKNLSSVLFRICNDGESRRAELLDFVRDLPEQDIRDVRFIETERNDVMVRLVESFGGELREIDAPLLSDGTLRVLAIAAALLSAPEGGLVAIEEIDNGVHPSRAKTLVEQMRRVSLKRELRVLVTTHNPALLDALPSESVADALCCYRDPDLGDSRIARLGDIERYPELVAQGSLGQLVTNLAVDRFLKDVPSQEERERQFRTWLDEIQSETTG